MSFVSSLFLWSLLALAVPILIALWNRRKHRKEYFGGYYLLKKVLESSKRKIQLLELLKLLNRLVLLSLLVLVFAQPLQKFLQLSGASEGFVVILDTSRVMQLADLMDEQTDELRGVLSQIPKEAQGALLMVSDQCTALRLDSDRQTASAQDWIDGLDSLNLDFANATLTTGGLSSCLSRAQTLFKDRNIFKILISPLSETFDVSLLEDLDVIQLQAPSLPSRPKLEVDQTMDLEKIRVSINSEEGAQLSLIDSTGRVESLGSIQDSVELVPSQTSWLWADASLDIDPWLGQRILPLKSFRTEQVVLWAQAESDGYLSLLAALRTHPHISVVRQIGGEPIGDYVIIYGAYPYSLPATGSYWFFLSPNAPGPFSVRDFKQWSPGDLSLDVRRSFEINTEDGQIFVRRYSLLTLDGLQVIETFDDGAPALLQASTSEARVWVTPFDLEDLTTDFSLEPTFIPYLFRRLDLWLGSAASSSENQRIDLLWALPGRSEVSDEVVQRMKWPGIFRQGDVYIAVDPIDLPEAFFTDPGRAQSSNPEQQDVSMRPQILKWLAASVGLELLLCLVSLRFMLAFLVIALGGSLLPLSATPSARLGVISGMDANRKTALDQCLRDIGFQSNLDFSSPEVMAPKDFFKASAIFQSVSGEWKGFREQDRQLVRDYLERGGLLVFDDPLATAGSSFYRSVVAEMEKILPGRSFKALPKDDVVYRSFYLMNEVSGRRLASANIEGIQLDERWVVLFSHNDILGANLRSASGDFTYSVSPYGMMQRILAKRLLLNILMYSLTLDYKDDAIHLPHILQRRVK